MFEKAVRSESSQIRMSNRWAELKDTGLGMVLREYDDNSFQERQKLSLELTFEITIIFQWPHLVDTEG